MNSHPTLLTADEAVHDLTLALLYLQRVSNSTVNNPDSEAPNPAYRYWDVTGFKSSTSYDSEVIAWLQEVGFVSNYKRPYTASSASSAESQHLIVTKAGVLRAREILANLNINDWDKTEILGSVDKIDCTDKIDSVSSSDGVGCTNSVVSQKH